MMQTIRSSETSVGFQWTTRCYIPEDSTLRNNRCENLRSYIRIPWLIIIGFGFINNSLTITPNHNQFTTHNKSSAEPRTAEYSLCSPSPSATDCSSPVLRPTVSQPGYLGIKHPCGTHDQIFITVRQLRGWCGALSLTRGRVCRLQLLLALASAVILGSESRGTRDHILCIRFETSLFVACCDWQGYGGTIRPRVHTGNYLFSRSHCDWRPCSE
jgi:hypothetical protein